MPPTQTPGIDNTMQLTDRLGFAPPNFAKQQILERLESCFGLDGLLHPLEGERDQNFRLETTEGQTYLVKISGENEDRAVVDFHCRALKHLQEKDPALPLPRILNTRAANPYARMRDGDNPLRVLTYLPGIPLAAGDAPTVGLASNAGHFLGRVSTALKDFSNPAQNHFMAWNLDNGLLDDDVIWSNGAADICALESELRPLLKRRVLARLPGLRRQVVHQDAHQDNLLRARANSETVVGLIDFGDMVESAIVCDLAILCLGFVERSISAQDCVAHAVAGYHAEFPLLTGEIDLLFDTMLARETLTVLLFDFKIAQNASASDYVREARPGLMKSLVKLRDIGASDFRDAIFDLCKL